MKIEDVPQDLKYLKGSVMRDVDYAVDADGKYHAVTSDGWSAKNDALEVTWAEIDQRCSEILSRIKRGEASPLEYHAAKGLMDVRLLAAYTGFSKRKVRRHMRPEVFATLSKDTLAKYADVLRITVEQLKTVPE